MTIKDGKLTLKPIRRARCHFWIIGTSPLIQHQWSEKARELMRAKHAGKKTKSREVRDPEQEAIDATYRTDDGQFGIPGMAFKNALITAAHKDIGIQKTDVRKAIFLKTSDSNKILPMTCDPPKRREDQVRVGVGSADLRYRPQFDKWAVEIEVEVDAELLTAEDVLSLVNRAGFGVGICEWRPEKNGEYGRFEVDMDRPFEYEEL